MNPTATNIISVWCKEYRKDPKKLKRDDWMRAFAYGLNVARLAAWEECRIALQNIEVEKAEGEPEGETTEPTTID
jgi:hypothetical protein